MNINHLLQTNEDFKIICNNNIEMAKVLEILEHNHPDIRWESGHKPTEWTTWRISDYDANIKIIEVRSKRKTMGYFSVTYYEADIMMSTKSHVCFAKDIIKQDDISVNKDDLIKFLGN